ncbi:MAG TPA: hypothetical protein PLS53_09755 [Thermoanaerobaculaceae bacterium]|nr:hypothetical protein [Thermoanaerobaculaceae bacterium]HPS78427.1 hypothetical protein [Thermoanaerobaculaceae bacterium]
MLKTGMVSAVAAVVTLFVSGHQQRLLGEQPTWAKVRAPLYGVLYHQFRGSNPSVNSRQGIWRLELVANRWRRLAPFFYWCMGGSSVEEFGYGSYLTATHDRLLFQGARSWIEVDPGSARLLRRYAEPSPATATRVQAPSVSSLYFGDGKGPFISQREGQPFNLGEGVYGTLYKAIGWAPVGATQFRVFSSLVGQPEGDADLFNRLSFDPGRGGLWAVSGHANLSISFLPVTGGGIDWAGVSRRSLVNPSGSAWLDFAYFDHELDALVLGTQESHTKIDALVKLDPATLEATVLSTGSGWLGDPKPWTLARLPKDPPAILEQTVPIVVRAAGRGSTSWSSELWLYNPSGQATSVTLRRVVKPGVTKTVDLQAHGSARIENALGWMGGGAAGDGVTHDALVVTSPYRFGEQVVAVSRVWTPSLDASEEARGGTMGQAVPAVPGTTGYSNHVGDLYQPDMFTGMNAMLVLDHREAGRFRHNLGLANDRDEAVTVSLWWGMPAYQDIAPVPGGYPRPGERQDVEVPAHGVKMVNLEALFPAAVQSGLPAQIAVTGARPVALWLSMVDNRTGDAMHVPYSVWWMVGDAQSRIATPAVAHLPGAKETKWLSDLYVTAREEEGEYGVTWLDQPIGRFYPAWSDRCGGAGAAAGLTGHLTGVNPSPVTLDFPWGYRSIVPDVVQRFAACAQEENVRGGLELQSSSWMSGYIRTYTTRADGGTYGEMMPFYPPNGWPVQHFAGLEIGPRFRLNLGLWNGNHDHAITHRLTLYAADGTRAAEREVVLQPGATMQERLETMLGKPLNSFAAGTYGLTVVPLDDKPNDVEGRSWAFVSMVDNVTGDPTNWW